MTDSLAQHPDIASKIGNYLTTARRDSPDWEPRWQSPRNPTPKKPFSQSK